MKILLNKILVDKLESISFDIKYYINVNVASDYHIKEELVDHEDIEELIEIRKK